MNTQDSSNPTSPCDELSQMLPAYAAGALNPEEVAHVKALLKLCPEMQSEVAEYRTIMTGFYDRIEPVAPPPQLHSQLMKKLRANSTEQQDDVNPEQKRHELYVITQTDIGEE
jgi:anti-sigma factor RsiW